MRILECQIDEEVRSAVPVAAAAAVVVVVTAAGGAGVVAACQPVPPRI